MSAPAGAPIAAAAAAWAVARLEAAGIDSARLDAEVLKAFGIDPGDAPDLTEVQRRLGMIQALEAVRALEQGVLTDIREGDVGAILGWGFMPWSGGPFSWLDILGAGRAVEICEGLAARHGERFEPPALLREMAAKGESFYGRAQAAEAAA